jgi:peptide/nickel transport system substrate-binding protein
MGKLVRSGILLTALLLLLAIACGAAATATPAPAAAKAPAPAVAPAAPAAPAAVATPIPAKAPTATAVPTPAPAVAAKPKLDRLKIAVAPLGWDTNFTWIQSRSGQLDKRPALEYLVGIDQNTGAYIPELATKWEMAPDGRNWTVTLRKGIKFIDSTKDWGEFTAKDVRHSVFLISQTEATQTDALLWRSHMGLAKEDTVETVAKKLEAGVEIVDDHKVVFHLKSAAPEFFDSLSQTADLAMESKARWDAGGKALYEKKVVGTGPFEFIERKLSVGVFYKRVDNHWRQTAPYKELEFRWVQESVTRLASMLAGEVHISDVDRALQKDALAKGMKILQSKQPAIQHHWNFGGQYYLTPDKLDTNVPWANPTTGKLVRQAMNMAVNRKAIGDNILAGKVEPLWNHGFHSKLSEALWPGAYNPDWEKRYNDLYGYNPTRAKELLAQAGYPNGFEFTLYLYTLPGLPEIPDIGQAIALDFQKIGLRAKLTEIDFPRVRGLYTTKTIPGAMYPLRHGLNTLDKIRLFNLVKGCVACSYEHPFIEEKWAELGKTVDPAKRAQLLRIMGDHIFNEFTDIPMFWLFGDAAINPKFISEYVFTGIITGYYTHLEYIKLVQ